MLFIVVYKDRTGQFRWQIRNEKKRVIADGSQVYKTKKQLQSDLALLKRNITSALVYDM